MSSIRILMNMRPKCRSSNNKAASESTKKNTMNGLKTLCNILKWGMTSISIIEYNINKANTQ